MEHIDSTINKDALGGILLGLAAGDRNGGPIRMLLRLVDSLIENQKYYQLDVAKHYYNWWQGPPHDPEKAFDTGSTFHSVFSIIHKDPLKLNAQTLARAAEFTQQRFGSAGVNAAHRIAPIAMASFIEDSQLEEIVRLETNITHLHQLSYEVALVTAVLLRKMITGMSWKDAIKYVSTTLVLTQQEVKMALHPQQPEQLSTDGFSPNVLAAAIHFMNATDSFSDAVSSSVEFAGSCNFCPVLVGAFAGAKYGASAIHKEDLKHCSNSLLQRVETATQSLLKTWDNVGQ